MIFQTSDTLHKGWKVLFFIFLQQFITADVRADIRYYEFYKWLFRNSPFDQFFVSKTRLHGYLLIFAKNRLLQIWNIGKRESKIITHCLSLSPTCSHLSSKQFFMLWHIFLTSAALQAGIITLSLTSNIAFPTSQPNFTFIILGTFQFYISLMKKCVKSFVFRNLCSFLEVFSQQSSTDSHSKR